jgi:hypothetical protein
MRLSPESTLRSRNHGFIFLGIWGLRTANFGQWMDVVAGSDASMVASFGLLNSFCN